jgi:hypothetical protein
VIDADHVLVVTDDDAGYDVRLDVPGTVTSRFSPGARLAGLAISADTAITIDNAGAVIATDPVTGMRWTIGHSSRAPFGNPTMSVDGKRVFAIATDGILMWLQIVPQTPEETRAFLDALTNARAPAGPAALTWD